MISSEAIAEFTKKIMSLVLHSRNSASFNSNRCALTFFFRVLRIFSTWKIGFFLSMMQLPMLQKNKGGKLLMATMTGQTGVFPKNCAARGCVDSHEHFLPYSPVRPTPTSQTFGVQLTPSQQNLLHCTGASLGRMRCWLSISCGGCALCAYKTETGALLGPPQDGMGTKRGDIWTDICVRVTRIQK